MPNKNIKTIAEILCRVLDHINTDGQYSPDIEALTPIINGVSKSPKGDRKSAVRSPDKYYYDGISCLDMDESRRNAINSITVSKGYEQLFELCLDRSLTWVMSQNTDGSWQNVSQFKLPSNKMVARAKLRKLADLECKERGYVERTYLTSAPAVTVPSSSSDEAVQDKPKSVPKASKSSKKA